MKIREVVRLIESDGWYIVATRGPGRVTVAGNMNDDLAAGTLSSVLKQAGLKGAP